MYIEIGTNNSQLHYKLTNAELNQDKQTVKQTDRQTDRYLAFEFVIWLLMNTWRLNEFAINNQSLAKNRERENRSPSNYILIPFNLNIFMQKLNLFLIGK